MFEKLDPDQMMAAVDNQAAAIAEAPVADQAKAPRKKRQDTERAPLNHMDAEEIGGIQFRRERGGFDYSKTKTLDVPEKYKNQELYYRWVNEDKGKVDALKEIGYAIIQPTDLSKDGEVSVRRRVGTAKDGSPQYAVLMATPKKWRKDRQRLADEDRQTRERGMFKKPQDEKGDLPSSEFYAKTDVESGYRKQL